MLALGQSTGQRGPPSSPTERRSAAKWQHRCRCPGWSRRAVLGLTRNVLLGRILCPCCFCLVPPHWRRAVRGGWGWKAQPCRGVETWSCKMGCKCVLMGKSASRTVSSTCASPGACAYHCQGGWVPLQHYTVETPHYSALCLFSELPRNDQAVGKSHFAAAHCLISAQQLPMSPNIDDFANFPLTSATTGPPRA